MTRFELGRWAPKSSLIIGFADGSLLAVGIGGFLRAKARRIQQVLGR